MKDHLGRDALAAVSLANLSLLGIWNALLYYPRSDTFFLNQPPSRAQYAAAMANVFLIGFFFFALLRLARILHRRYGAWASAPILIPMALPAVNTVAHLLAAGFPRLGTRYSIALLATPLCLAPFLARSRTLAVCTTLLVILSPMIAMEAVVTVVRCRVDRAAEFSIGPRAPLARPHSLPRVVWIVFDELDYRITFPDRPPDLDLPQFDRLRAQSVFATHAIPPTNNTVSSVTSLLTGTHISSISAVDASHADADGFPLTSRPTIFSAVHGMGGNSAAVGWYLPYCRLFSAELAACAGHGIGYILTQTGGTFAQSVALQQRSLLESGSYSAMRPSLRDLDHTRMIQAMREEARRYAADPSLQLVFLHLPTPHAPHCYDRRSRAFNNRSPGAPASYADSLALADLVLGEIRSSMNGASLWDATTVLVTSDHPNRASRDFDGKTDPRVPFLLKLAGQETNVVYDAPLHTIVIKPLLEAIFRHQIESAGQTVQWLHAHD